MAFEPKKYDPGLPADPIERQRYLHDLSRRLGLPTDEEVSARIREQAAEMRANEITFEMRELAYEELLQLAEEWRQAENPHGRDWA